MDVAGWRAFYGIAALRARGRPVAPSRKIIEAVEDDCRVRTSKFHSFWR